ncbi:MAG: sigma-70 family RNA polymerase sigma factor [Verrucomicrobiota bacterium]
MEQNSPERPRHQEERKLIERAQAGDQAAFGVLFKTYYDRVYRTTYGILDDENEAKEATQRTWIKAWEHLERFNHRAAFTTWLHRITVNTAIDETRRKNRYWNRIKIAFSSPLADNGETESSPIPPDTDTPAEALLRQDVNQNLRNALGQLPLDQREVFTLREFEGLSYEAIAETLEIKPGTVMSRLHLARKKLQTLLNKESR